MKIEKCLLMTFIGSGRGSAVAEQFNVVDLRPEGPAFFREN